MADTTAQHSSTRPFVIAWVIALLFYVLEYATRSSPAVMIPQLSTAFGETAVGVSAILGAYYYTYSLVSLVAGGFFARFASRDEGRSEHGDCWQIRDLHRFSFRSGCRSRALGRSRPAEPRLYFLVEPEGAISTCSAPFFGEFVATACNAAT